jgi:hypothetical protein
MFYRQKAVTDFVAFGSWPSLFSVDSGLGKRILLIRSTALSAFTIIPDLHPLTGFNIEKKGKLITVPDTALGGEFDEMTSFFILCEADHQNTRTEIVCPNIRHWTRLFSNSHNQERRNPGVSVSEDVPTL